VGFLRRRRLTLRGIAVLIVVLAFAGSLAAAYFAMSEYASLSFMHFTPLHAIGVWVLWTHCCFTACPCGTAPPELPAQCAVSNVARELRCTATVRLSVLC
jgi:hypothetical protein